MKNIRISISTATIVVLSLFLTYKLYQYVPWKKDKVFVHDIQNYYSYLPALFIYDDLTFKYGNDLNKKYPTVHVWAETAPNGEPVQKMTCGTAIMYFPFFISAHGIASISDNYDADGYSRIYANFISLSALIYAILSMIFMRRILKRYFSDMVVALVIASIYFGSNLYFYIVHEGPMSHIYSFFLIAVFIDTILRWFDHPTFKKAALAGLVFGLTCLIRPTNILIILFPLLYGLSSVENIKERFTLFIKNWSQLLLFALVCFIVGSIQMKYWHMQTGDWIYYSYNDESFFFSSPHIVDGLFSYRKGFFVYAPLMMLGFIGLFLVRDKSKQFYPFMLPFAALYIWVCCSWWCWWYGGSFGNRSLLEMMVVWAIPIGALYEGLTKWKRWTGFIIAPIVVFFAYLSIFQSYQYREGYIHYDSMTKAAYWKQFMEDEIKPGYYDILQEPNYYNAKMGNEEFFNWSKLQADSPYSDEARISTDSLKSNDTITVIVDIHGHLKVPDQTLSLVIQCHDDKKNHFYHEKIMDFNLLPTMHENQLVYSVAIPDLPEGQTLKSYLWYKGKGSCFYRSIKMHKQAI